ncbi:sarcosine oxidase subunit gamma [Novosphingobium sp. Fuku2-ISO-50]|uniref:sarcosine oxidase subunit gamma n=1 Tax=Novosphingobium sp. Fuku2-ISO-50 TaxID=1739114 RepID=UPI00076C7458|nr:sarcosine oxidase subunit gamma family protein [Novosphingobium sp. Fuku2-ISO-50]KUR76593.1 hypothetical protein AQZ50_13595 [Novosphingobium sp. Fuku2-ISO-50]
MVDVSVRELAGFGLANVLPRAGIGPDALGTALGLRVISAPVSSEGVASEGAGLALWGTGPGQWLAFADAAAPDWAEALGDRLAGLAAVVDQSSAYTLLQITGADARRLLQKGVPVDLSALAPGAGAVVVSVIAHVGVIVHQTGPESFHLAIFRSFAGGFRDWLDASIAAL